MCTIFTLTDSEHALFCNNEDWEDPKTRIWFVNAKKNIFTGKSKFGCAYVGFSNQWGQGGVNSEGLAYDWVAGNKDIWNRDSHSDLKILRGNMAECMLESCATIDDAIAFYKVYWESSFSYAKILIADRTGKSVIISAKNDKLQFDISMQSRGFGQGFIINPNLLEGNPVPTLTNASKLLKAALQEGQYATKYSNVFDLKTGDIYIYRFPDHVNPVKLNLIYELKKGNHYYDIPAIEEQLTKEPKSISLLKKWLNRIF